jgi:hypothetical protein
MPIPARNLPSYSPGAGGLNWFCERQEGREAMDLDRFLREENIRRYRRLIDSSIGETERETIFKLLAEEMEKMKGEHRQKQLMCQLTKQDRWCLALYRLRPD